MSIKFKIASQPQKVFDSKECLRNLNLLGHAQLIMLETGSCCGGHGKCGKDIIKISKDDQKLLSPITDDEKRHLSKTQLDHGYRLSCQCFPEKDNLDLTVFIVNS